MDFHRLATELDRARHERKTIAPLTRAHEGLGLKEAYRIQRAWIELRQARGEKIVGYKMGLTSKAKMEQMGLHTPIFGVLFGDTEIQDHCSLDNLGLIHPKAEPEIALRTSRELSGRISTEEALDAIATVAPAIEILDSRYTDFKYFSLPDVVADNSSSSHYRIGKEVSFQADRFCLPDLKIRFFENNKLIHEAQGRAVLGDPLLSLVELAHLLSTEWGMALPKGSLVLTGAATAAVPLQPGQQIRAEFDSGLGSTGFQVGG